MNGFDRYADVQSIFQLLSQQFGTLRVDLSVSFMDLRLFRHHSPVNLEREAIIGPFIDQRCFDLGLVKKPLPPKFNQRSFTASDLTGRLTQYQLILAVKYLLKFVRV